MKIKKAKNLKEINICLYAFFGVLLILAIRSAFSGEKWDCAVLGLLMLILFLLFMLINLEWEVDCAGITCYILFGKIKVKTYLWSNFCYVGSLLVLGKGRTLTSEMIVCAENKPYKNSVIALPMLCTDTIFLLRIMKKTEKYFLRTLPDNYNLNSYCR